MQALRSMCWKILHFRWRQSSSLLTMLLPSLTGMTAEEFAEIKAKEDADFRAEVEGASSGPFGRQELLRSTPLGRIERGLSPSEIGDHTFPSPRSRSDPAEV